MEDAKISMNPLCEFVFASTKKKATLVRNQKKPITYRVARYRLAKSRMVKFIKNGFSYDEIISGINDLQAKQCLTEFQRNDRNTSIEALRLFLELQFPKDFDKLKCSFVPIEQKEIVVDGVLIIISPDLILRWEKDGKKYIGGIKFHISKSSKFDYEKASFAAGLLYLYLQKKVAGPDEIVDSSSCLCVDVFSTRICSTPRDKSEFSIKLKDACHEIKLLWEAA
jgi:hypothetical protein